MSGHEFKELMVLSVYGELDNEQSERLARHLESCVQCRAELAELRLLHERLSLDFPEPPEYLLHQARYDLASRLRSDSHPAGVGSPSGFSPLLAFWRRLLPAGALVQGAALMSMGLLIGYLLFSPGGDAGLVPSLSTPGVRISNVLFSEHGEEGGVALSFQVSRRFEIRGTAEDAEIQRLLTYALLHEGNAGTRLKAVGVLDGASGASAFSQEARAALVGSLKTDRNPAVRQEVLAALTRFPIHKDIQDALIFVLERDPNARLRIEAINALTGILLPEQGISDEVLGILRNRADNDENEYIRSRARGFLRSAGHQLNQEAM